MLIKIRGILVFKTFMRIAIDTNIKKDMEILGYPMTDNELDIWTIYYN